MYCISNRSILAPATASLLVALGLTGCAMGHTQARASEYMIQSAETKSDHEAIASLYEQAAADALKKADMMRKHLAGYEMREIGPVARQNGVFVQPCNALIRKYQDIAKANNDMAKLHWDMAQGL